MAYYTKTVDRTLSELETSQEGLSIDEVLHRSRTYGPNEIRVKGESLWRKLIEPFANVFVLVLAAAATLSIATGHNLDAIIIAVIILISATIYYVQSYSTERVLRALKKHEAQLVSVLRGGQQTSVDSSNLVPGDIVLLAEGEKVPADGRLIHAENLRVDEAMLTGESVPIGKHVHALDGDHEIYEQSNMVFQGSFIVSGRATYAVTATAMSTEYGQLAKLSAPSHEQSPAERKIDSIITKLILAVGVVAVVVFALALFRGVEPVEALRFVMSLSVSAVPEGLPVAITVVLVLGMRRLARYNALARSMSAIENIGIITTIASDKTGTLTKNKLCVQDVWQPPHTQGNVGEWMLLSSNDSGSTQGDPLDGAMRDYAKNMDIDTVVGRTFVQSFSFDQALALSGNIWQVGDRYEAVIKGAPERIIQHSCASDLDAKGRAEAALHHLTGLGYRVIAVAHIESLPHAVTNLGELPLTHLRLVGLIGIADELRPEALQAIKDAQTAGITVRMITGDHAETAYAIGKKLALVSDRSQVLDCRIINTLSDDELSAKVDTTRVFARVVPEAKHRILGILKLRDITAMTGDGVNDVPALTNAHVGIAMGSGSQIAKEASDIVLLDNNFATIIRAVEGGRVIYDNIRRMLFHLLATSLGEVLVMIGALVVGLPLPVVAVQILWINLVTDTTFDISLGLEPAEDDVMKRPPRRANQPILDSHMLIRIGLIALTMAVTTLIIFALALKKYDLVQAQTIAFSVLVITQWANALNARSEFSSVFRRMRVMSWPLVVGFSASVILQLLATFGPLSAPLYVEVVDPIELAVVVAIGFAAVIVVGELHKWWCRQTMRGHDRLV